MARRRLLNASYVSAPTLNAQTRTVIRPSSWHCLRMAGMGTRIRGHEKTLDDTPRRWETRILSACSYDTERRLPLRPQGTGKKRLSWLQRRFSGFTSLGVIRELLRGGASLDAVDHKGRTVEAFARDVAEADLRSSMAKHSRPS